MKHYKIRDTIRAIRIVRSNYAELQNIFDHLPDSDIDLSGHARIQMRLHGSNMVVPSGSWLLCNSDGKMRIMSNGEFEFLYQEL